MTAVQKLLVNLFMAAAAIARRQSHTRNHKSVMIFLVLPRRRLVALQAVHALLRVFAHLVFMHHRILQPRVALGALPRSPDELCAGLFGFHPRSGTIDKKCSKNKGKCDDHRDKDRAKRHRKPPSRVQAP
jgi:hypothetical protein